MKLAHHFILFVSLPVLACLAVLSILLYDESGRALEAEHEKRLLSNAGQTQGLMGQQIEQVKSDLTTLLASGLLELYFMYDDVGQTDYAEDARASLEEYFLAVNKAKAEYASLQIYKLDGEGIINITGQRAVYRYPDIRQADWFKTTLNSARGKVCVSGISYTPEHQMPSIFVSQKIYYWGQPRAMAIIQLHCQAFFTRLLRELSLGSGVQAYLVDSEGRIIAHADPALESKPAADRGLIAAVLDGRQSIRVEPAMGSTTVMKNVYMEAGIKGAVLVFGQPLADFKAMASALRNHLIWISVLVGLGLAVLIYATVRTIVRPLTRLQKTAGRIAAGELDARVAISRPDEIGSLASAFDAMAVSLQSSRRELRAEINERRQVAEELREALAKVKQLSGFLPICSSCKKIRDDKGYWQQIESYLREHSEAEFSHGICPECVKKLYPYFQPDSQE